MASQAEDDGPGEAGTAAALSAFITAPTAGKYCFFYEISFEELKKYWIQRVPRGAEKVLKELDETIRANILREKGNLDRKINEIIGDNRELKS